MTEKDIEYQIKSIILNNNNEAITITNELQSDGIVRYMGRPIAILEFKNKKNFKNPNTAGQVLCQIMCYYYKLLQREPLDQTKPFYLIMGDDNEVILFNLHNISNSWLVNQKWGQIAPSKAGKEPDLLEIATSLLKVVSPVYYEYEDSKELNFGLHLLFSNLLN